MHTESKSKVVQLGDLKFSPFITASQIHNKVKELGEQIKNEYPDSTPLLICILNGSFIFCSDLVRAIDKNCEVQFLKVSSYKGTQSTGEMTTAFDTLPDLEGRDIILVEDIIDQGHTIHFLYEKFSKLPTKSLRVASLLLKPEAYKYDITIDYLGFKIPNDFVVGYGLDYDQMGRNLPDIYTLSKV